MTSRRAPKGRATQQGWCYTLHLVPPLSHAKHYTGWSADLAARLAAHEAGNGPELMAAQTRAGGSFIVAGVEWGTRDRETQLKERGASRRCPICKAGRRGETP